jgi:hypothetical protein
MVAVHQIFPSRRVNSPYPTDIAATYLFISHSQYNVFRIMHFVGPLSILGSLAIICRIVRIDRHDPDASGRRTYYRLLVAMSICDVVGSLALSFGVTPIPRETLLSGARGTTATCTAQGFFIQWFTLAVLYYNSGLMIYFVMTIRYGWTESRAAKCLEPVVHVWSILIPLAQAVAGLFLDLFNPIGFGNFCHISSYPPLCGVFNACTRGEHAKLIYTLFCTIPESISLAVIYVSIVLIYCTVRNQSKRALAISANQESVKAKMKTVAVQSWLFAIIFFNTWVYAVLGPLMGIAIHQASKSIRAEYILSVLASTFLPLQGFFNFCIYIRPRYVRLRAERRLSVTKALMLAVFGGKETLSARRRSSIMHHRRRSSFTSETQSQHRLSMTQPRTKVNVFLEDLCTDDEDLKPASHTEGDMTENDKSNHCLEADEQEGEDAATPSS